MDLILNTWFSHTPTSDQHKEIKFEFDKLLNPSFFNTVSQLFYYRKNSKQTILRAIKRNILRHLNQQRILIKDPIALFSAGWLYRRYKLKVVCLIRNPLGFVGSLKKANWNFFFSDLIKQEDFVKTRLKAYYPDIKKFSETPGDIIDHGCLLWNIFHSVILEYQDKYPSWFIVKHEKIASDPVNEYEKIFRYLDLKMDDKIISMIKEYTSQNSTKRTRTTAFRPRDSRQTINAWKYRLTSDEIERVKMATDSIAKQFYTSSAEFEIGPTT